MVTSNHSGLNPILGLYLPLSAEHEKKKEIINRVVSQGATHIIISDNPIGTNAFLEIERYIHVLPTTKFWSGITSPLYYHPKILTSMVWSLHSMYPERVGLGISTGDLGFLKEMKPAMTAKKAVKALEEFLYQFPQQWNQLQVRHDKDLALPPVAVGGLGNKMIQLAASSADYLFLNSSRVEDIVRARSIINDTKGSCSIIPLVLLEYRETPSLFSWYMVKRMLKFSPNHVLEGYDLNTRCISKIRELDESYPTRLPQDEDLKQVFYNSIVTGTVKTIITDLTKIINQPNVTGLVLRVEYSTKFYQEILPKLTTLIV